MLGSFVGVRCTRFAHSAHPHCARRRTFAIAQVRSFRRAQRQLAGTLGAILFLANYYVLACHPWHANPKQIKLISISVVEWTPLVRRKKRKGVCNNEAN